ncbi:cytochrome P450 [Hysterangium stoloniferum]|nr:cytochrome P450 [Hysterangium stoloniferum]
MLSLFSVAVVLSSLIFFQCAVYVIRRRDHPLKDLRGPPAGPWLVGNYAEYFRPYEIGDLDFKWIREYGSSFKVKGAFGDDVLFTADPKSLQYIYNTAGYNFPKPPEIRLTVALTTGKGVAWVEGEQHARHRKIMNPAFSYGALRGFLPLFRQTAQKTVIRFKEIIANNGGKSTVIDIPGWIARTTLDAIGAAAFDFQFNAVEEGSTNELAKVYSNLFADTFFERSDELIIFDAICSFMPQWFSDLAKYLPNEQMKRLREYMKVARKVAQSILDRQTKLHIAGKEGSKDVMSILIRANLSENPKNKLSDEEIISQLTTINLAGHETTAMTLTWALHELSRHPDFQNQLREEIAATRAHAAQRGDSELSIADLDSMKLLQALIKETLRYHPIVSALFRQAGRDDVIPLLHPIKSRTGDVIESIPVRKGQRVLISIAGYQRLKSVWGEDADVWRPERFLEGVERYQTTGLGVISNVATFSSGVRSCIGWRFAMIEMQAILIEFLENFEFSVPPGNIEIIRGPTGLMTPMVKGSKSRKTELPLSLTAL